MNPNKKEKNEYENFAPIWGLFLPRKDTCGRHML